MTVQVGLCRTWLEILKTGFLTSRLNLFESNNVIDLYLIVRILTVHIMDTLNKLFLSKLWGIVQYATENNSVLLI